jgi:N-acetylneuraminic acid mutarotase
MNKINLLVYVLIVLSTIKVSAQDTWQQIAPTGDIPTSREGHSMITIDSLVYLFGGKNESKFLMIFNKELSAVADKTRVVVKEKPSKGSFDTMHIYLPSTQEWMEEEPNNTPPPARSGHKAVVYNGKMYVFFGEGSSGALDDIWEYDPDTREWIQINPGSVINPSARYDHSATVYGNMVYIVGGINSSGSPLSDCWAYNFTNNQWEQYANIIGGNINGHAAVINNGELLIYGGLRNGAILDPDVYKYSSGSDSWQVIASQGNPYPTANAAYVKLDSDVFIFGGYSGYYEDDCFKWNLNTQHFTQIANGPAIAGASAAMCPLAIAKGAKITNYEEFVLFGGSNEGLFNNNTWLYTSDIEIPAGVKELGNESIKVYPNPSQDFITIEISEEDLHAKELTCQLCDINGKVLKSKNILTTCETLDISGEAAAIYFVRILEGENVVSVFKRIKQ